MGFRVFFLNQGQALIYPRRYHHHVIVIVRYIASLQDRHAALYHHGLQDGDQIPLTSGLYKYVVFGQEWSTREWVFKEEGSL